MGLTLTDDGVKNSDTLLRRAGRSGYHQRVEYFCAGVVDSFDKVKIRAAEASGKGKIDQSPALRRLDPRQRKTLDLFNERTTINSRDVENLFGISQRSARNLLSAWVEISFLIMIDPSNKGRKYSLADKFKDLLNH